MDSQPTPTDPRTLLLEERARILADLKETAVEAPGPMTYGSQAAAASHVFEQQRDLALRDHDHQRLAVVDAALERLDAGTYGLCTACHRPIPADRLEALPWTPTCIDCSRTNPRHR
jgi:RNA polymerase-binding protein DksA